MLKLKLQYFGHLMWRTDSLGKTLMLGKMRQEKRTTEDEIVGWHHRLNGHGFKQPPGVGDGQGSLACCSPWGCKQTWLSDWTELILHFIHIAILTLFRQDWEKTFREKNIQLIFPFLSNSFLFQNSLALEKQNQSN